MTCRRCHHEVSENDMVTYYDFCVACYWRMREIDRVMRDMRNRVGITIA